MPLATGAHGSFTRCARGWHMCVLRVGPICRARLQLPSRPSRARCQQNPHALDLRVSPVKADRGLHGVYLTGLATSSSPCHPSRLNQVDAARRKANRARERERECRRRDLICFVAALGIVRLCGELRRVSWELSTTVAEESNHWVTRNPSPEWSSPPSSCLTVAVADPASIRGMKHPT